jgi:ribosome-binding factor A
MPPISRTVRVGEQIRNEIAELLTFHVRDPGIGFITITQVKVTPDLQQARVYYTTMGDDKERRETQRGLERARPMMRRHLGQRMRLKRVPELQFFFDEAIERQDRIERILLELQAERAEREAAAGPDTADDPSRTDGEPIAKDAPDPEAQANPDGRANPEVGSRDDANGD